MKAADSVHIERAELFLVPLRLREPFETSGAATRDRSALLVALHAGGLVGWGECVAGAVPGYTPETGESAWAALAGELLPVAVGRAPAALRESTNHDGPRAQPMARAAIEMAAWDLEAKGRGLPLCEALGGARRPVPAGIAIGLQPDDEALLVRVGAAVAAGYRRVKLKIEPGRDVAMVRVVRDRFPDAPISVDANGAYSIADLPKLRELDQLGLLMIEQPLAPADLTGHARVQAALRTPICLDESITSVETAGRALELGSCAVINLKPGRVGGFRTALEIHDLCRARGVPLWCGGMLESGVGRAHNVALATLPGFTLPGDLSPSDRYWERDLVEPEWRMVDGGLEPLAQPGIGVEPDRDRIEALAVRRHDVG
jgi:O-succinylbenzoate synthase